MCGGFGLLARDGSGSAKGFIRAYPVSHDTFRGEYLIEEIERLEEAILLFSKKLPNARVRFDFTLDQEREINLFKQYGFSHERRFLYYDLPVDELNVISPEKHRLACDGDVREIMEVLNELHQYTEPELLENIRAKKVFVLEKASNIVSAAVIRAYNQEFELVEFAVEKNQLRRGIGREMLNSILSQRSPGSRFFLKVDSERLAAIKLYEKVGFHRREEKSEVWLYRYPR